MKIPFKIERATIGASHDSAIVVNDEDPSRALAVAAMRSIGTDVEITIGTTTMFLAAWEDPEHWAEDWAEKLDVDLDDVPEVVARIIAEEAEGA